MLSYHSSPLASLGGKTTGGMNVTVRELSRQLGALGHQVDIFTRATAGHADGQIEPLGEGVRVIALAAGPQAELDRRALAEHIPAFTARLLQFAASEGGAYDLIHCHYWMSGLVGLELKAAWGAPMLLMMHTLGLVKSRIAALGEQESRQRIAAERRALAAADRVIAATPAEQADLQWLYEVRTLQISVIPPGVDQALFRPLPQREARRALSISADANLLLYVGRIEAAKGVHNLILAAHQLAIASPARSQKLLVQIVGGEAPDEELERLMRLGAELGLAERVEFLGRRPQAELPRHYAAADVVVVPSYFESFGMVALEAMACARPVLASRVGGLAYLVQDGVTGYHVAEGDVKGLATRLEELLGDQALLSQLGANGPRVAADYSWAATARRTDALYRQLA